MTGKEFIKFLSKRGIPLSCIASKLGCKLANLRAIEKMDAVPKFYLEGFFANFKDSLSKKDKKRLMP
ncbi:hypothetical protein [Agaribacter flavus]|uniref:XRE family transcriptional regulator n=1 Tax=Agaribacter flavus TaxID=1902781 RepID=A0ABV7FQZ9_9ALTE